MRFFFLKRFLKKLRNLKEKKNQMNLTISSITNLVKEKVGITLKGDGKNKGEKQPEGNILLKFQYYIS